MPRRPRAFPVKGVVFRSKYEAEQATRLWDLGIIFKYEGNQIKFLDHITNGRCITCDSTDVVQNRLYTPDFYFPGTGIFVETKGLFDQASRRKMKAVCTQSEEDVRMCFMRDNWLTKKHKMNYSRWCQLNGILYAVGDIPLEWCKVK